jgi:hypothetical protein
MFALLSFFILTHNSSKQIKETLIIFENWGGLWSIPRPQYQNSSNSYEQPKLTANEKLEQIWKSELKYLATKHKLSKDQLQMAYTVKDTFFDAPIMVYVAFCESSLVHKKNGKLLKRVGGSDSGLFQINRIHEGDIKKMGLDLSKIEDYFAFTRHLYDKKGTGHWYMSEEKCWGEHDQRIKKSYNI